MSVPADAILWLRATAVLVACWSIVAQLEWVVNIAAFRPGGALHIAVPRGRVQPWLALLLSARGMTALSVLRLGAAVLLLVAATPAPLALGFALTAVATLVLRLGLDLCDGSDKMGLIVAVAGLLGALGLWRGDAALGFAGVLLAGGQLTLCYIISGASKLLRRDWRSGTAIDAVMRSAAFGHPHGAWITRSRAARLIICWTLMLAETLFPLALLGPAPILYGALALFLGFHFATAYFMRLNTFALAFPAAFPATLLLGASIRAFA